MLYNIHVKNLALIKEQEVELEDGLNILTGETGAGKSVIIGSINLALGAKADKASIRTGEEYALVELTFGVNDRQREAINDLGLSVEDDGTLIISRKIQPTRSIFRANGESISTKQLKDLSNILINIHGQNDHQELLHKKKHLEILDEYCGKELSEVKGALNVKYAELRDLQREFEESNLDQDSQRRELELLEFETNEIVEADLKNGEDDQLENDYRRMSNSRKIMESLNIVTALTSESSEESTASDLLERAYRQISQVSSYDSELDELKDQLGDIDSLISDFNHGLSLYMDKCEFDEEDFRNTEERLNQINHLKEKYGSSIEQILQSLEEKNERLEFLSNIDAHRDQLAKDIEKVNTEVLSLCEKISKMRKASASKLEDVLKKALEDLNFLDVRFEIRVTPDAEHVTSGGFDDVEFMISTNPGEDLRPLNQVASGGELSRIMLGLKTVIAGKDDIDTLIFDEIDAGISGKTAWKVSEKLGSLSGDHQIICITHLPQIACMADTHFVIQKGVEEGRSVTRITRLSEDESIDELARLLGTEEMTDAVRSNAAEMKHTAAETKQKLKAGGRA